jgi:UDP-N-acetyl-D-glucosamine dehydrogenase
MSETVGVIGQGYVGLELAISLSKKGHKVIGFENDNVKLNRIRGGSSPVENVSNLDLIQSQVLKKYEVTSQMSRLSECRIIIVCVPTPLSIDITPDLSMLEEAVQHIASYAEASTLVINESTSYPGTLRNIVAERINSIRGTSKGELLFGVAPERVSPGNGIPLTEVPRVVSGLTAESATMTHEFYSNFCVKVHLVNTPEIAEAAKLLENTFRQVNIAFINEFNLICRAMGIDTRSVIEAANTKPYGFMKFEPSSGIGGHCIPVDPLYFQYVAEEIGHRSEFIELATRANSLHPKRLLELVLGRSKVKDPRILILGVAYKSGISDTRESPAELFFGAAKARNLDCGWIDPLVESWLGLNPSSIDEKWDIAIVVTQQPNLPVKELLSKSVEIYDFTGGLKELDGVVQI